MFKKDYEFCMQTSFGLHVMQSSQMMMMMFQKKKRFSFLEKKRKKEIKTQIIIKFERKDSYFQINLFFSLSLFLFQGKEEEKFASSATQKYLFFNNY